MNLLRANGTTLAGLLWMASATAPSTAATLATIVEDTFAGVPKLAIGADGLPVILYAGLAQLEVARCADWACSSVSIQALTGVPTTPDYALAIGPGGNPAVAFRDAAGQDLKFVRCTAADCSGALSPIRTIEGGAASESGYFVDVEFGPDGRAAFAYMDLATDALKYARCSLPNCTSVDIQTLSSGVQSGQWAALAFGGRADPVVSAHWSNGTSGDGGVHRFDCASAPCANSMLMVYYQAGEYAGEGQDMALLDDDTPVFSFVHGEFNAIYYGRCFDPQCSGRYAGPVDDGAQAQPFNAPTAIAVRPGNRPLLAYRRDASATTQSALMVIECGNITCSQRTSVTVDQSGSGDGTGSHPDMVIDDDGAAVIAYIDVDARALRLARCSATTCAGPADRLFANGFD